MKIFVHTLIIMATLALGSVALADAKTLVITGRVVEVTTVSIDVQSGKERVEINTQDIISARTGLPFNKDTVVPKVGDTVTVYYTGGHHVAIADPEYVASKIEVKAKAVGGTKPIDETVQVPGENIVLGTVVSVRNGYIDIPNFGQIRTHEQNHLYQPKVGEKVRVHYHLCGKIDVCADKIEKVGKAEGGSENR